MGISGIQEEGENVRNEMSITNSSSDWLYIQCVRSLNITYLYMIHHMDAFGDFFNSGNRLKKHSSRWRNTKYFILRAPVNSSLSANDHLNVTMCYTVYWIQEIGDEQNYALAKYGCTKYMYLLSTSCPINLYSSIMKTVEFNRDFLYFFGHLGIKMIAWVECQNL